MTEVDLRGGAPCGSWRNIRRRGGIAMVELTSRQLEVFAGIQEGWSQRKIARSLLVSPQAVNNVVGELRDLGVIRRRGDVPETARVGEGYVWEPVPDMTVVPKVPLPPQARLKMVYAECSHKDLRVPPIRQVWWPEPEPRWSVQGIPMRRPDGKPHWEAVSGERVVVVTHLLADQHWLWVARTQRPWRESQTELWLEMMVSGEVLPSMTLMIAAVLDTEAVMDVTGNCQTP